MRKVVITSLLATVAIASAAEARGPMAPGQFMTGLDEAGMNAVIAQTEAAFPGVSVFTSYDVILGTWTVEIREFGSGDSPTE